MSGLTPRGRAFVSWSAIAEPHDREARALVAALGPEEALEWARTAAHNPAAALPHLGGLTAADARRLRDAAQRWKLRLAAADPDPHLERADRVGAAVIARGDDAWPSAFDSLGPGAPYALWVRGDADVAAAWESGIALVGSRSCTAYGGHVARDLARGLAGDGWSVISGGAFGIDIRAHQGALDVEGVTVAVMAGGVDRLYPRGNADALEEVCATGAVVAEVPPGYAPHRSRFLTRNRLIAAARATVVIEAAHRSGALSTAYHAAEIGRPVGAVPGPVTSPSSAGCHRLMREGAAVVVTGADEVAELAGPLDATRAGTPAGEGAGEFASQRDRQTYDALTPRGQEVEEIARRAGLSLAEARAALGALALDGRAERSGGSWRSVPGRSQPAATPR